MNLPELCLYMVLATTAPHSAKIELEHVSYTVHEQTYYADVARLCSAWNMQVYFQEERHLELVAEK